MKTNYNLFMLTLYVSMLMISGVYAQGSGNNEPRFATYHTGQAFTSITADANKNVWAGTTSQGLFFMDQTQQTPTFSAQTLGTAPAIGSTRMTSMAKDQSGNIWIAHEGINTTGGQGGIEKINVNTLAVQHFGPGINARGFTVYSEGDGIPTRRVQQIVVDPNNKVWTAHRYHDVTSAPDYIVTPGSISSRMADASGPFENYSTWNDWQNRNTTGIMLERLPYPAYTYNPPVSVSPDSRTVNAISVDRGFIYISVYGYNDSNGVFNSSGNVVPTTYLKPRLIKYTNTAVPQFVSEVTTQQAGFPSSGGIFNGVYANGSKGVWATTPFAGNGFSVYIYGTWQNVNDPSIIPPGTVFNKGAIWGDSTGRVYMGTNNGLLVYDGFGEAINPLSYTLYSKTFYDSLRCVHDPDMLSNNITAGCIESSETENYSWIATPDGIMRCNLPTGEVFVYHVKDKEQPFTEQVNGSSNYEKFTSLRSTHYAYYLGYNEKIPSFAVDGTQSSVLRLKTDDPGGYYDPNTLYRIVLRKTTSDELPGDPNSPEYIAQYGKFTLKPIEDYEGQPQVQDLKYVDFIYQHPTHIQANDFILGKYNTEYDIFVFKRTAQQTDETIFRHPIKLCLPPVLLGHGVWSNTKSLDLIEAYFKTKGYSDYEIRKAWRYETNPMMPENSFDTDKNVIPTYIESLISSALDNKVSAGKVNVIVHSRGGLYTRAYIEELRGVTYKNNINSLITLNTPHFGSQAANAILDQRTLALVVKPNFTGNELFDAIVDLTGFTFTVDTPIKIGDIMSVAALHDKPGPDNPGANHYGVKNLTVENDNISGKNAYETRFIGELNESANASKLSGIPIHAVATKMRLCNIDPILCTDLYNIPDIPVKLPRSIAWAKVFMELTNFVLNDVPVTVDTFLENYLYNDTNDLIVPTASMEAGLADNYISKFPDLNVCHITALGNERGVTGNTEIIGTVFSKLKQKFDASNSNFSLNGIVPQQLSYTLPNLLPVNRPQSNQVNDSKIVINPSSFTPALQSGSNSTFKIYQENVDKIFVVIEYNDEYENTYYLKKVTDITFENDFTVVVPNTVIGKIRITAYGIKDAGVKAMHTIESVIALPDNITLESIRFSEERVVMPEKSSYNYTLFGTFSDGFERRINELPNVVFTVGTPEVLSLVDTETVKTLDPGNSNFQAAVNGLTTVMKFVIADDPSTHESLVSDFYPVYEETGPVQLIWKTYREYRSQNFTLESSTDNINFTQIDSQNGQGTKYEATDYEYVDNTTENLIYYRLKLMDLDNNVVYNQTIQVVRGTLSNEDFEPISKNSLVVYPNPSNGTSFTIHLDAATISDASVTIYNMNGSQIAHFDRLSFSNKEINVALPNQLSEGIYMVQIKTEAFVKTEKLIIQK